MDNEKVNLAKGWSDFWNGIKDGGGDTFTGILALSTAIGALIVVMAIAKWLWEKRRGGGGGGGGGKGSEGILWALALGALMAAPNLLLPAALTILDFVANGIIGVFTGTTGVDGSEP